MGLPTTTVFDYLQRAARAGLGWPLPDGLDDGAPERADYQSLSFEQRLGLLVDRESQDRDNRRLERNLKAARLRERPASRISTSPASAASSARRSSRSLKRSGSPATRTCSSSARPAWARPSSPARSRRPPPRRGHTALYARSPRLLGDLALARADGRLPRLMSALARVDVLVIDDLALQRLAAAEAADLLEVVEDRSQLRSTIVTSHLPVSHWHEALGEPTVADAILDRLVHNAHRIELRGDSLRRPQTAGDPAGAASKNATHTDAPPRDGARPGRRLATKAAKAR